MTNVARFNNNVLFVSGERVYLWSMAPAEESDSGMESLSASSSKDLTPEKPTAGAVVAEIDSDDDDLVSFFVKFMQ